MSTSFDRKRSGQKKTLAYKRKFQESSFLISCHQSFPQRNADDKSRWNSKTTFLTISFKKRKKIQDKKHDFRKNGFKSN